jgi:4-hydroxy-L-threonine phosphate dehydrogenase PdxA
MARELTSCQLDGFLMNWCSRDLTMFHVHNLRVFFVSRHMALKAACDYANKARVLACVVGTMRVQGSHGNARIFDVQGGKFMVDLLNAGQHLITV